MKQFLRDAAGPFLVCVIVLTLIGCAGDKRPVRQWRVEAVTPYGKVAEVWYIESHSAPMADYRLWGGKLCGRIQPEIPVGWMFRITEVKAEVER